MKKNILVFENIINTFFPLYLSSLKEKNINIVINLFLKINLYSINKN
jgi:hypothetical protein